MNKTTLSLLLAATSVAAAAAQAPVETRAYYSTNASGAVGRTAAITIDGDFSDWSDDMIIATCGANDMCNAFHGSHENCVVDLYALYAAWDDANLYLAWQMCNTGDTWAREGDGPLTDGGRIGDVPLIVALSVDPSSTALTGRLDNGNCIWRDNNTSGVTFSSHVDHLLYMSAKPGGGDPAMFTAADKAGNTNYGSACHHFSSLGIRYAMAEGFAPSHLWRQRTYAEWSDATTLVSDPSIINNIYDADNYDNLIAGTPEGLKPHDTGYDSFYEMSIPFKALGINREWLEKNGIGVRVIGTRGESGIDCCPFDPSMVDNVFEIYGKDDSTSHEKDDFDDITYALASAGALRTGTVDPLPDPGPDPDPTPDPTPVDGNYVIYFDNTATSWSAVTVWVWDAADGNRNFTGGTWPGQTMTADPATGYHRFSFNCENAAADLKCIFSNSGAGQTKDLDLVNHGIYNSAGYTGQNVDGIADAMSDPTEGTTVYYNLQGVRLDSPLPGQTVIAVTGGRAVKTRMR